MSETDVAAHEVTPTMAAVAATVGAPDFLLPWLDRFYDGEDAELVLAAAAQAAGGRSRRAGDGAARLAGFDASRLERAVRRAVLDVDEAGAHAPADFRTRLEIWAIFEGWKDVPFAVHRELADWEVENYTASIREGLEALKDGRPTDASEAGYTYLLLSEAEEVIAGEARVYLWPCDCRAIVGKCRKPVNVCLRFENDRGLGWEISTERAIEILRATDRAGLMHTDYIGRSQDDPHAICSCCTDCCFPHLATERLGAADVWPVRRHVASIDRDLCKSCGRCGLRCPFDAIVCRTDGRPELKPSLCRGCGLCATGCSNEAIQMLSLATG